MADIWDGVFAGAHIGRKLVSHFRAAEAWRIETGVARHIEIGDNNVRRIYRLSMYSAEAPMKARGLITGQDFDELIQALERLEKGTGGGVL